ncbi:MAG: hypothetical protein OXE59_09515 [Bacteroidetes bacterium]|nr:hypothetical protein [Bacteroidota bacterium]MCY4233957.1 hypothetical protein [Bacteroidota bacterium]
MKRSNPLGRLFAKYLAGQIDESVWNLFLRTLESYESNPSERSAMIAFVDDILVGSPKNCSSQMDRLLAKAVKV